MKSIVTVSATGVNLSFFCNSCGNAELWVEAEGKEGNIPL